MRVVSAILHLPGILLIAGTILHAQQDVRINDDTGKVFQENPSIVIDPSGAFIVAWSDQRNGANNPQVYAARSTDGGRTWSMNKRISSNAARPTGGMEMGPTLALGPNGSVVAAWADIRTLPAWSRVDVRVARSTDGGATFSGEPRINSDMPLTQHQPSLATGPDGTVYATWHAFPEPGEQAMTPVFVSRSTDGGNTFAPQQRVDSYDPNAKPGTIGSCNCCRPWIFTDNTTNIYVAFRIDSAKNRDIFLARSSDRGATWERAVRVSKGMWTLQACPGSGPGGTARNDTVFVSWMDKRPGSPATSVYIARSTDGGATFGPDILIDQNANFPSVTFDNQGRVFVLWNQVGVTGNIYCAVSDDGGLTFGAKRQVNTGDPKERNTGAASAIAPDGTVYGVWTDTREDEGDIRFSNLTELMTSSSVSRMTYGEKKEDARIYPNPSHPGGEAEVELEGNPSSAMIIDLLGRVVRQLDPHLPRQRVMFDESGVYFLVADFDSGRQIRPCIVTR